MDKNSQLKQVRRLNSHLTLAREQIECAEAEATSIGDLHHIKEICSDIGRLIKRVSDLVPVQVFAAAVKKGGRRG
jgi:hypothetical protein